MKKLIIAILIILFTATMGWPAATKMYGRVNFIGGTKSVDNIAYADLVDGDLCLVVTDAKVFYLYRFESSSSAEENSPLVITPDDEAGAGRWEIVSDFPTAITIGTAYIYRVGGTDVSDADVVDDLTITSTKKISNIITTEQLRLGYDATNYITVTVLDDGHTTFITVDPDGAEADINFDPDGNVGIKTADPSTALEVTGTVTATAFAGPLTGEVTGNASTATALATTRAIGGVNFDGTAAITPKDIEPVDTADENATFYPLLVDGATGAQAAETDGELTYNPSTGLLTAAGFAGAVTGNASGTSAYTTREISTLPFDNAAEQATFSEANMLANSAINNQGAGEETDIILVAVSYPIKFAVETSEAFQIELCPPAGEIFTHDGTPLDANDCILSSATVGSSFMVKRIQIADGSWQYFTYTIQGVKRMGEPLTNEK